MDYMLRTENISIKKGSVMSFFNQFALNNDGESDQQDADGAGAAAAAILDEPTRDHWTPDELPSAKRARDELGEPEERKFCFGCIYELSTNTTQIPNQAFKELVLLGTTCIGQMSIEALSHEMARIYERFRSEINARRRHEDGTPLPPWSAASIAEHLVNHNVDPEVQTWVQLVRIQEMQTLCCKTIVEINDRTGQPRLNRDALCNYERLVKLWHHVASKPLDKQFAYRKGARMDVAQINQPIVTKRQKCIVDYYSSGATH